MIKLAERIGLPLGQLQLHQAILEGIPQDIAMRLADEIDVPSAQIAGWLDLDQNLERMSPNCGDSLCRLIDTLELLMVVMEGNLSTIAKWLTTPNFALSNEQPIQLLRTEVGGHLVRRLVLAIEHGLPV